MEQNENDVTATDARGLYYSLDDHSTYYHRHCTKEDITTYSMDDNTEETKRNRSNLLVLSNNNTTTPEDAQHVMMKHGAVILPNMLSDETATKLRSYLESRHAIQDQLGWQEKFWTGINRLSLGLGLKDDPSISQALYEIGTNELLQTTLQGIFGTPDAAVVEISTLTTMHGAENQGLHSDSDYFGSSLLYGRTFLHSYTMFVALQDTTSRMGATTVCAGTHWCANEDMNEFCLPYEYEYQQEVDDESSTTSSSFAEYNNANEAFDVSSNGITAKEYGIMKKGDAMMFNQNAFHRGPQNDDPNFKDMNRVMFIVTFVNKRDYESYGDVRRQGMGTYYYQRWTMWGHLYSDFQHVLSSSTSNKWKQPWATLHAWGVLGGNHAVPWTEHVIRQFANQMDFYEPGELPDFKEYLESSTGYHWFGKVVQYYLHDGTSNTDWHDYVPQVLNNMTKLSKTVYAICLVITVLLGLFVAPNRKIFLFQLVLWHFIIGSMSYGTYYGLTQYSYLGRKITTNQIHVKPFPKRQGTAIPPPKTTLPDRMDFLIGTRYDAEFLGSYNHALDYHPGNIHLNTILQEYGSSDLPLFCLTDLIFKQWQQHSSKTNKNNIPSPPRMLYQDPWTGYWTVLSNNSTTTIIQDRLQQMIVKQQSPLYQTLDTHLLQVLANARFGRSRDTIMAQRFEIQWVQYWQEQILNQFFWKRNDREATTTTTKFVTTSPTTHKQSNKSGVAGGGILQLSNKLNIVVPTTTTTLYRSPTRLLLLHNKNNITTKPPCDDDLCPKSRVWAASVSGDPDLMGRWESATILDELDDNNSFVRVVYGKNGMKQRLLPKKLIRPYQHWVQGDRVQVLYEMDVDEDESYQWVDGTILSVSPLGFLSVQLDLDDGIILPRVSFTDIRVPLSATNPIVEGDIVWANFVSSNGEEDNSGYWKRAKVVGTNLDSVSVEYSTTAASGGDNGPVVATISSSDVQDYFSLEEGDFVQVLMRDGYWWDAEIYESYTENGDDFFFAVYIAEANYYVDKLEAKYVRPVPPLLKVGTRVMANFGNEAGTMFPGSIDRVDVEGRTYNIMYDDGDFEENVPRDRIQVTFGNEDDDDDEED
eukprot:scaffold5507_cov103-Cylindrotheca_fusiformis.AAC.2